MSQIDAVKAKELAEKGMAKSLKSGDAKVALRSILNVAQVFSEFTTDDVRIHMELKHGLENVANTGAVGAAFRRAAFLGLISSTNKMVSSSRKKSHSRKVLVWKSRLITKSSPDNQITASKNLVKKSSQSSPLLGSSWEGSERVILRVLCPSCGTVTHTPCLHCSKLKR